MTCKPNYPNYKIPEIMFVFNMENAENTVNYSETG